MLESCETNGVPLSLGAQRVIDDICDAFEARLRSGEEPRIEDALASSPEPCRPQLFRELLKMEQEYRQKRVDEDYRRRFSEYASVIWTLSSGSLPSSEAVVPCFSDASTTPYPTTPLASGTIPCPTFPATRSCPSWAKEAWA